MSLQYSCEVVHGAELSETPPLCFLSLNAFFFVCLFFSMNPSAVSGDFQWAALLMNHWPLGRTCSECSGGKASTGSCVAELSDTSGSESGRPRSSGRNVPTPEHPSIWPHMFNSATPVGPAQSPPPSNAATSSAAAARRVLESPKSLIAFDHRLH